jgi:hypothetical protein
MLDADEVPGDRWVWASLHLDERGGQVVVCDADGGCPADAPTGEPDQSGWLADHEGRGVPQPTVWLARAGDGVIELRRPAIPHAGVQPNG